MHCRTTCAVFRTDNRTIRVEDFWMESFRLIYVLTKKTTGDFLTSFYSEKIGFFSESESKMSGKAPSVEIFSEGGRRSRRFHKRISWHFLTKKLEILTIQFNNGVQSRWRSRSLCWRHARYEWLCLSICQCKHQWRSCLVVIDSVIVVSNTFRSVSVASSSS